MTMNEPVSGPGQPLVSFPRGNPTAEQIAVVVAVLAALPQPAGPPTAAPGARSEWSARYRLLRAPLHRGPGGWRASALPR
jgi:hypothetical protein